MLSSIATSLPPSVSLQASAKSASMSSKSNTLADLEQKLVTELQIEKAPQADIDEANTLLNENDLYTQLGLVKDLETKTKKGKAKDLETSIETEIINERNQKIKDLEYAVEEGMALQIGAGYLKNSERMFSFPNLAAQNQKNLEKGMDSFQNLQDEWFKANSSPLSDPDDGDNGDNGDGDGSADDGGLSIGSSIDIYG